MRTAPSTSSFGPERAEGEGQLDQDGSGQGWFPIFRFYGPAEAFFDKTWKLEDIVMRSEGTGPCRTQVLRLEMALLRHAETGKSAVNAIRPRE